MRIRTFTTAMTALVLMAAPRSYSEERAAATERTSVVALTLKAGTLGYGADITFGLAPQISARFGINMFNYEPSIEDNGDGDSEEINMEINWQTIPILFDWHPWSEEFRFTAGAMINNNELVLTATTSKSVEINDQDYYVSDLEGKITFQQVAPYLGIGWGNAVGRSRVHFSLDLGLLFQGAPEVALSATASDAALQARLDTDLASEKKNLEEDLEPFDIYPVISLGFSVRF